jgi:hypothetical protein
VARWRTPLTYCIFWLLTVLFVSLTFHVFDLWGDEIRTFLGGWPLGVSLLIALIVPAIAARAIMQWLLRVAGGSGASESSAAQPTSHPVAAAALVAPAQIQPNEPIS